MFVLALMATMVGAEPVTITVQDAEQPESTSEAQRWLKAIREKVDGKDVSVKGTLFAIRAGNLGREKEGQFKVCINVNSNAIVYVKMTLTPEQNLQWINGPDVTIQGKGRV